MDFKGKKVLIMGLGLHGGALAVAKWILRQGARLTVTDLRSQEFLRISYQQLESFRRRHRLPPINFVLGRHRLSDFSKQDLVIQNPAVPNTSPYLKYARQHNVRIMNEAALFFSLVKMPIIGVTGSKGKSTTTALLGEIFKKYNPHSLVAGNIRTVAMFDIINIIQRWQQKGREVPIILELSSWHLEGLRTVRKSPSSALVTNIFPEHLNRYSSFASYIKAKELITKYQRAGDFLFLNKRDKISSKFAANTKAQTIYYSPGDIPASWKIKLPGKHNLENVAAAVSLARQHGIPNAIIKEVVENFSGLPDRLQLVREYQGIKFYNDTTATAPIATVAALRSFPKRVILLAGGSDKNLPLDELVRVIKNKVIYCFLFSGAGSNRLFKELIQSGYSRRKVITDIKTMPDMVGLVLRFARSGDIVLLSPGFASFSNFINEFDRGEQFNKIISALR